MWLKAVINQTYQPFKKYITQSATQSYFRNRLEQKEPCIPDLRSLENKYSTDYAFKIIVTSFDEYKKIIE